MRWIKLKIFLSLLVFLPMGCVSEAVKKSYILKHIDGQKIVIDGRLDESQWSKAEAITSFSFPWQDKPAPFTEFRAFCDEGKLCFAFTVVDGKIVVEERFDTELVVDTEDRVEIFFAGNLDLNRYYCVEIDPHGRIHDYVASYYRKFDSEWDLAELKVKSLVTNSGYTIEAQVSLESLFSSVLPETAKDGEFYVGLYRAEFSRDNNGELVQEWVSWVNPDSKTPDFHIPSSFGLFYCDKDDQVR